MSKGEPLADGRGLDPRRAALQGEAAEQKGAGEGARVAPAWSGVPSRQGYQPEDPTYYGLPVLKEPVWIWSVPAYFYLAGMAGAAGLMEAVARVVAPSEMAGLRRRCRLLGSAGTLAGAALLVIDLGRPGRFLNMLRVLRPSSPMSVGAWVVSANGALATGSALWSDRKGILGRLGTWCALASGVLGPVQAGYTAVLLSCTALPVWSQCRHSLPFLFAGSSMAALAAWLDLAHLTEAEHRAVRRFGLAAKALELAAAVAVERELAASGSERVGRPLRRGLPGLLWYGSQALTATALALSLKKPGRRRRTWSAFLSTLGALGVRLAVFLAGWPSARDPRATFEPQRRRRSQT
jgi:formate-dependent nitrite reductase membrane component NrfD